MQYKRILMSCLIVILILCASLLCIGATEEAPEFKIAVDVNASTAIIDNDSIVVKSGDTFEVSISINGNPTFVALDLKVNYDADALTLLGVEPANNVITDINEFDIDTSEAGAVKIKNKTWTSDITANGKLVTLKFKVKDGAHSASPVVSLSRAYFMTADSSLIKLVDSSEKNVYVHDLESEYKVDVESTCSTAGQKSLHCKKCDAKAGKTPLAMLEHAYGEWIEILAPTCVEKGTRQRTCTKCSNVEEEAVEALDHTYNDEWTYVVEPGCTTSGAGYRFCQRCNAQSATEEVAPRGHSFGEWITTESATCTAKGSERRQCTVCQHTEARAIAALGHNYSEEWTTDVEPTCSLKGSKSHHCERCGDKKDVTKIDATGHEFTEWTIDKAPTCTKKGVEKRTCPKCNAIEEERSVDALGHNYSTDWTIDVAATCLTAGSKSHHCANCGDKKDVTEIPVGGHTYGEWIAVTPASCTERGTEKRTCTVCKIAEETRTVEATGHKYSSEWTIETEATCTTPGSKAQYCACGEKTNVTEIPVIDHNFGDWTVVEAATCTESGSETRSCRRKGCGHEEVRVVEALGHTSVACPEIPATKNKVGFTGGTYCSVCGETLTQRTEIPKLTNLAWLYIVLAVVAVACVGGGAYVWYSFFIKKKAPAVEETEAADEAEEAAETEEAPKAEESDND